MALYGGWVIYKKGVLDADARADQVKRIENKYLDKHSDNMIKLQNFTKKVFAIGIVDDVLNDPALRPTKEYQMKIASNAQFIRDFIKDLEAEAVVLEFCEERYQEELYQILSHPNYDKTLA